MSALARFVRFAIGGAAGAAIGGAAAYVLAPQSGSELSGKVQTRIADAKLAGAEAQSQTEQALINRFRAVMNDPAALTATEMSARAAVTKATQDAATAGSNS